VRVTFIAGLPGSGKTHLGNCLASQYPAAQVWFVDDITELSQLVGSHWSPNISHMIVTDPHFCRPTTRPLAEGVIWEWYQTPVEWIFFENNPEQCRKNVRQRIAQGDDRKVMGMIDVLTKIYTIPKGADVRPVYCAK
jgi:hypothetical protein